MKIVLVVFVLSLPLLANGVAKITALKGSVEIQSASVSINATLGASLQEKDSIITADKSKAQIIFNDETIVTVGKNSNFSIAKYIFDDKNEPAVEFSILKGAMKAITGRIGKIAPQKFKVKTKTATIGIRGTNFTVISMDDGSMRAYCTYGAISVTIGNQAHIVKQGFYLSLSTDGKVVVKEFSADELKGMEHKSFGERKPLKSGEADKGTEPNNTSESVDSVVIKELEDKVQDAVQTADDPSSTSGLTMRGFSIDNDRSTDMQVAVGYTFAKDGVSFESAVSKVSVDNKANAAGYGGEYDDWSFQLAATPNDFVSKDEFTTSFSSVYLSPQGQSSSKNASLLNGSFSATNDLSHDDYMTWGTWNASVEYTFTDSSTQLEQSGSHDFQGLWVAGEVTESAVVDAIQTDYMQYYGKYQAYETTDNPTLITGTANMTVNFGSNTASLVIAYENGDSTGNTNYSMNIVNNVLVGTQTDSQGNASGPGEAYGTFYGPNAESVGGNFSTNANGGSVSEVGLKGVYQATQSIQ